MDPQVWINMMIYLEMTCRRFSFEFLLLFFILIGSSRAIGDPDHRLLFSVLEAGRGVTLIKPSSIAVDTLKGEVYLTDRGRRAIFLYNESGQFLQEFGKEIGLHIPYCLMVDPSLHLVAGEQDKPKLWLLDLKGRILDEISLISDDKEGILPGGVSPGPEDNLFVVNRYGNSVIKVNLAEKRVDNWYTHPENQDGGIELQDIITLEDRRVLLLSSRGSVVHVLDAEGRPLIKFGRHGSTEDEFSFPSAFAIGPRGKLWIIDTFQHSVKVFDLDGTFINEFGEMGTEPGELFFPIDIAFGRGGKLFILEKGKARLQAFQLGE
jgi:hypothetical protein